MEVIRTLEGISGNPETIVALGTFDGVHKGHQHLINSMVEKAKKTGLKSVVFTFCEIPQNTIVGEIEIKELISQEEKIERIQKLGVDYLILCSATKEFLGMEPEAFVQDILLEKYNMKEAYCGFNYHFGANAKGNADLLMKMGEEKGFRVTVLPPFTVERNLASSSLLRMYLCQGKPESIEIFTGYPFHVTGVVTEGKKLGRELGFPTLNLIPSSLQALPTYGVYMSVLEANGREYPSVTNIGVKPTVDGTQVLVETHILNEDTVDMKEGTVIQVNLYEKIRREQKFESVDQLKEQISYDCRTANRWHKARMEERCSGDNANDYSESDPMKDLMASMK